MYRFLLSAAVALVVSSLCGSGLLHAEWSGGLEGGAVNRDGKNSTRLRLRLSNDGRPFSHYVYADWLRADDGGNAYELGYKPRYWFSDNMYAFVDGSVKQNQPKVKTPTDSENETSFIAGAGYQQSLGVDGRLWLEVGAGQQRVNFVDSSIESASQNLGILRGGAYQVFADLLKAQIDAEYIDAETSSVSEAELGLSVRVAGGAVKVSYRVISIERDGFEKQSSDDTAVSFTYSF